MAGTRTAAGPILVECQSAVAMADEELTGIARRRDRGFNRLKGNREVVYG